MKQLFTHLIFSLHILKVLAQPANYFFIKGHSHNDYNQAQPFVTAFEAGMASIEADVFLLKKQLYVAHTIFNINSDCTFDDLYLQPIGLGNPDNRCRCLLLQRYVCAPTHWQF